MPGIDAAKPSETGIVRKGAFGRNSLYGVGLLLSIICLYFFAHRAADVWKGIDFAAAISAPAMLVAIFTLLISYAMAAFVWRSLVEVQGANISPRSAVAILLTTQLGKYLPGNIGQHIGRVALAKFHNVPVRVSAAAMMTEMALVMGFMMILGFPALLGYMSSVVNYATFGLVALALAGGACWIFAPKLRSLGLPLAQYLSGKHAIKRLSLALILALSCALTYSCVILPLHEDFMGDLHATLYVVSIFCGAWVAGFVTPGAPAGLGIREWILSEGMAPLIGPESATIVALLLRVVTTIADLMAFGIGTMMLSTQARRKLG
ncbi:MAG: lysylphosphatidylglycerol synthase domain-containing protein [Sphingobium sp.]